jgi:hypothetical protein
MVDLLKTARDQMNLNGLIFCYGTLVVIFVV